MAVKVFISYRRDDSKYQARMIHAAFCRAVPRDDVFMDVDSIPPGANFRKILKDWVDQCGVLLALIGPGWIDATDPKTNRRRLENTSDFVRIEIAEALARDIPVVPVLLDGTPMPDPDQLPADLKELADRQAEFVEYRTFDADVDRLIRKLRLDQDARQTPQSSNRQEPKAKASEERPQATVTADQPPAFGKAGVVFAVGVWRIVKVIFSGLELMYLWTGNGDKAIELVAVSNGYWRLRSGAEEKIVFPTGSPEDRQFYDRPWLRSHNTPFPVSRIVYEHKGTEKKWYGACHIGRRRLRQDSHKRRPQRRNPSRLTKRQNRFQG